MCGGKPLKLLNSRWLHDISSKSVLMQVLCQKQDLDVRVLEEAQVPPGINQTSFDRPPTKSHANYSHCDVLLCLSLPSLFVCLPALHHWDTHTHTTKAIDWLELYIDSKRPPRPRVNKTVTCIRSHTAVHGVMHIFILPYVFVILCDLQWACQYTNNLIAWKWVTHVEGLT